jgi:hypothetical protein
MPVLPLIRHLPRHRYLSQKNWQARSCGSVAEVQAGFLTLEDQRIPAPFGAPGSNSGCTRNMNYWNFFSQDIEPIPYGSMLDVGPVLSFHRVNQHRNQQSANNADRKSSSRFGSGAAKCTAQRSPQQFAAGQDLF